jgi:hypothetical protein
MAHYYSSNLYYEIIMDTIIVSVLTLTLIATINATSSVEVRYSNIIIVGASHKKEVKFKVTC